MIRICRVVLTGDGVIVSGPHDGRHTINPQMAVVLEAVIQQRLGGITTHAVPLHMRNLRAALDT